MSRVIGVDFGVKRVGLAISDPLGLIASPLEVVPRAVVVERVSELVAQQGVSTIVVGMPKPLGGGDSESSKLAHGLGEELAARTGAEVRYVDERFTSRLAEDALLESGMKRRDRRVTVDKVAAAIILQAYLDGNSQIGEDVEDTGAQ